MEDYARIVAAGYDAVAAEYAALEEDEWPRLRWLGLLLEQLPDGSAVLDLGCGNGLPVGPVVTERHALLGVDVSRRQVELARSHVPAAEFVQADLAEVDFPAGAFDAVVCLYALGHVPRERQAAVLARIRRWLRAGGLLLLSEEDADRPDVVADWLGVPMFFGGHDARTLGGLVEAAGFVVEQSAVETQVERGVEIPFAWILARSP